MTHRLITSLLLYPTIRREILEVARANGEAEKAHSLIEDLDRALVQLGELVLQVERSGIAMTREFRIRVQSESAEVRRAAERFSGISDVSDKLSTLFRELADWLDREYPFDSSSESTSSPNQPQWN